jgi:hypothetical protein
MDLASWRPFHENRPNRALHAAASVLLWTALMGVGGPWGALALIALLGVVGFRAGPSVGASSLLFAGVCALVAGLWFWHLPLPARMLWALGFIAVRFALVGLGHKALEKKFHPLTLRLLFFEHVNLAADWTGAPRGL